jgi:4-amino-4-deoxy-L-arabinose transferase-like glycosyltransferase
VAERRRSTPAWAWLAVIVVGSIALRVLLGRRMPGPFIFTDELTYSELAKSFAASGHFLVRGVPTHGYGFVYPVLISPAYRVFHNLTQAYAGVKAINSVLMSLAAVPAYFLARRMLGPSLALLAAVLAVTIPSMAYTGTVMTENAFYPLFVLVVLLLVRQLEHPTVGGQIVLLALVGLAYATRAQAVALVPPLLLAPPLLALLERKSIGGVLRPFAPVYACVVGGGALLLVAEIARGRSVSDLLGAYSVVGNRHYSVREIADFALWGWADLDLYLGVIPLAAAILLIARTRRETRPVQAFVAVLIPLAVSMSLVVAAFNTQFADNRIEERNLFYLAPLLLVALLVWIDRRDGGASARLPLLVSATVLAVLLPLTIPFDRFVGDPVRSDSSALVLVWSAYGHLVAGSVYLTVGLVCAFLGLLVVVVPRGAGLALPLVVLAWFAVTFVPIFHGPHGFERSSAGAVFQGIRGVDRDWVDRSVPPGAHVAAVWSGLNDRFTIWQNEFFNRAVGRIYYVGEPTADNFPETRITFGRDGYARTGRGRLVSPPYVLTDGSIQPDGVRVGRDPALDLTVWRLRGPLFQTTTVTGLYPGDTWSGERVTWTRRRCKGGELDVTLSSDPHLYQRSNTVTATTSVRSGSVESSRATSVRVPLTGYAKLQVPLVVNDGRCVVQFTVSPTLVPRVVTRGQNPDPRRLGAHFNVFDYRPPR